MKMANPTAETVAASVVREYLSRKGLRCTLQMMDEEMPRTEDCISKRPLLIKELQIEKLMKKNRELENPLRAMLEVIIKHLMEKGSTSTPNHNEDGVQDDAERKKPAEVSDTSGHRYDDALETPVAKPRKKAPPPKHSEMLLEDTTEGETLGGEGRAGIMDREREDTAALLPPGGTTRLKSGKLRGMSGPISSSIEGRDRKKMKRPTSSHHHSRPDTNHTLDNQLPYKEPDISNTFSNASEISAGHRTQHDSHVKSTGHRRTDLRQDSGRIEDVLDIGDPVLKTEEHKPRSHHHHHHKRHHHHHHNLDQDSTNGQMNLANKKQHSFDDDGLDLSTPERPTSRHGRRSSQKESREPQPDVSTSAQDKPSPRPNSRHRKRDDLELDGYDVNISSIKENVMSRGGSGSSTSSRSGAKNLCKVGDLEVGDEDDLEAEMAELHVQEVHKPIAKTQKSNLITNARPIDIQTAVELKTVIFGTASKFFNDEWLYQSFTFSDQPRLQYGIVQKKGGPCGVLAAVQAMVLQEMLFNKETKPTSDSLEPSRKERTACLAAAISAILWRAGQQKEAVVTLPCGRSIFAGSGRYKPDNVTETLVLNIFSTQEELHEFIKQHINTFELEGSTGVVLFTYSLILSRTIPELKSDMDVPTNTLMGAHGYCSQELVNLILTGKAASNVFNDKVELDSGTGPKMILKGIHARSDIGLLSLFEHYKSCEVGTFLKTPRFPIWVVCSESHFSVLFSLKKELMSDWKVERKFDLYYYDGLARQDEEIRLTIETTNRFYEPPSDDDLVPPLEHCIRTKWKDAQIDWNGTEPIL
ncbi:probable ubiquitin carboxyl-terminal hydrolase MINDY-4 [Lingula anatina]|uniref:Ubiquitin carboxyl-terminal hydrolase MINDY n=1 Tax=Lingula anatina TaxID=7574 RepID=A0A1S3IP19_LINAN|nr:probable ubiquitin carboxyl-terminal hydrolase MINDY-4 [Lingula anatina]|eukprot:XP_013399947.1 probable ubiquitin carboxyl-terminal hydrolase MINDY-4 [Lingula anatina]